MSKLVFDFAEENFVVTGASSGLGREVTLNLAKCGAKVLAIGRNVERLEEVRLHFPTKIFTAAVDVCDSESLDAAINFFVAEQGKLNGAVHAAGTVEITPLRLNETSAHRKIMNTSFWAGMELLRLVTKNKYCERATSSVLFSSIYAHSHEKGMLVYSAAKAAVEAGIKTAAKEISAQGHRVNAIVPGWIKTAMTDSFAEFVDCEKISAQHLLGEPEPQDVSDAVLFLLSSAAKKITGSCIVVDGGYLA